MSFYRGISLSSARTRWGVFIFQLFGVFFGLIHRAPVTEMGEGANPVEEGLLLVLITCPVTRKASFGVGGSSISPCSQLGWTFILLAPRADSGTSNCGSPRLA